MGSTPYNLLLLILGNDIRDFIFIYRAQSKLLLDLVISLVRVEIREKQLQETQKKLLIKRDQCLKLLQKSKVKKKFSRIKTFWRIGKIYIKVSKGKRFKKPGDPFKFTCENNFVVLNDELLAKCKILIKMSEICLQLGDEFEKLANTYFYHGYIPNILESRPVQIKFKRSMESIHQKEAILITLKVKFDEMNKADKNIFS